MRKIGYRSRGVLRGLAGAVFAVALPFAAFSQSTAVTQEQIERALARQGYEIQQVSRTLLGRVHIIATRDDQWREVVLNPSTGEILRDLAIEDRSGQGRSQQPPAPSGGLELN